jgi:hypothetical protein
MPRRQLSTRVQHQRFVEKRTVLSQHSCSGAVGQDVWQVAQPEGRSCRLRLVGLGVLIAAPEKSSELRQPVKKVSGSPLAQLSDSTWVNILQNPARRRLVDPLRKSSGCKWALPRLLAPLGSPLRRLWALRLNTNDVSCQIEEDWG